MKTTADVVIIGGGIAGASVAYHLAEAQAAGLTVVLLEQRTLASGTTGKSVAVLEFQHSTAPDIRLRQRSLATYQRFFQQPDSGVCFQQIGGIQLTATQPAADDLRETVRLQQRLGVSVEWLEPHQESHHERTTQVRCHPAPRRKSGQPGQGPQLGCPEVSHLTWKASAVRV